MKNPTHLRWLKARPVTQTNSDPKVEYSTEYGVMLPVDNLHERDRPAWLWLTADEARQVAELLIARADDADRVNARPSRGWVAQSRRNETSNWRHVASGFPSPKETAGSQALSDEMQRAGFRYSELHAHLADLVDGHVLTAEDGTQFRLILSNNL